MDLVRTPNICFLPRTGAEEQNRLPLDVLSYIFLFCDVRTLVSLSQTCRDFNRLDDRLWKPIALRSFPCPESLTPASWKGLLQSHDRAAKNLFEGTYAPAEKRAGVTDMLTYGRRQGEATHLALMQDGGYRLMSWDLDRGIKQTLLQLEAPFHCHSIIWQASGEGSTKAPWLFLIGSLRPDMFSHPPAAFSWVYLNLFNAQDYKRGSESILDPQSLSPEYKKIVIGGQPAIWTGVHHAIPMPPVLIHSALGEPYFLKQDAFNKSCEAVRGEETIALPRMNVRNCDLHVIQPKGGLPSYLIVGNGTSAVHTWNTSTWTRQRFPFSEMKNVTIEICHRDLPDSPLILASETDFSKLHIIEFDQATGSLALKHSIETPPSLTSFSPHRLLSKDLWIGFLNASEDKYRKGMDGETEVTINIGSIFLWDGKRSALWKWDNLYKLALCYRMGKPILAALSNDRKVTLLDPAQETGTFDRLSKNSSVTTVRSTVTPSKTLPSRKILASTISVLAAAWILRKGLPFLRQRPALSRTLTITLCMGSNLAIWRHWPSN